MDSWFRNLLNRYDGYGIALYVLLACLVAGLCTSIIGLEREMKGQSAGLRTHVLISMACCLLMSISIYAVGYIKKDVYSFQTLTYDATRIGAGILGGIGFVGAGTVIKSGHHIRGLTTAVTIWLCSAIGMACGCGFVLEAILVTLLAMVFLLGLSFLEMKIERKSPVVIVEAKQDDLLASEINEYASNLSLVIKNFSVSNIKKEDGQVHNRIELKFAYLSQKKALKKLQEILCNHANVISCSISQDK